MITDVVFPQAFTCPKSESAKIYLADPAIQLLVEFFNNKGLLALKEEDRREQWYEDWLAYQSSHHLYAQVLSPRKLSTRGGELDILRLARFIEVFAYFSPAHGYSFQVTLLGLFSILMGSNEALKQEAVAIVEAGGLLAFGVSEKGHGADLLGNEFTVGEISPGKFIANGSKHYIGNTNAAAMISILASKQRREKRTQVMLIALRPKKSAGFGNVRKIHTLGVRAGFVGAFDVKDHEFGAGDIIADGRSAWDAIFGAITLGKFFLGFGSIGICQHAIAEASVHLGRRMLFGKSVLEMPHIRQLTAQAYARLTAMKLYAYRALDYAHAASASDRRYLLFCAVQKAKVSTEGVKVMTMLSECAGARAFEADTYMEMALRDVQLIPAVEGSTHVNLSAAAQFIPRYFAHADAALKLPPLLVAGNAPVGENAYLLEARTGGANKVKFAHFLKAYRPLKTIANVMIFARQVRAFQIFVMIRGRSAPVDAREGEIALALGNCLATIAYGQLIAESAAGLEMPPEMVSAMFHGLVMDMSGLALSLAASTHVDAVGRILLRRMIVVPRTSSTDWDFVAKRVADYAAVSPSLGTLERAGVA